MITVASTALNLFYNNSVNIILTMNSNLLINPYKYSNFKMLHNSHLKHSCLKFTQYMGDPLVHRQVHRIQQYLITYHITDCNYYIKIVY